MKIIFSLSLFVFAVVYTFFGYNTLDFMTGFGTPGPGYFPLIIGIILVTLTGFSLSIDIRKAAIENKSSMRKSNITTCLFDLKSKEVQTKYTSDVVFIIVIMVVFIGAMPLAGGLLSMIAFMLGLLFYFNKKSIIFNLFYSLSLPLLLYFIFDVWLNASLPQGILK